MTNGSNMNEIQNHEMIENSMLPEETPELLELYKSFDEENLMPLWTQLGDLMPVHPSPRPFPTYGNGPT